MRSGRNENYHVCSCTHFLDSSSVQFRFAFELLSSFMGKLDFSEREVQEMVARTVPSDWSPEFRGILMSIFYWMQWLHCALCGNWCTSCLGLQKILLRGLLNPQTEVSGQHFILPYSFRVKQIVWFITRLLMLSLSFTVLFISFSSSPPRTFFLSVLSFSFLFSFSPSPFLFLSFSIFPQTPAFLHRTSPPPYAAGVWYPRRRGQQNTLLWQRLRTVAEYDRYVREGMRPCRWYVCMCPLCSAMRCLWTSFHLEC